MPETLKALSAHYKTPPECLIPPEELNYDVKALSKNALRLRDSRLRRRTKNFCAAIPVELMDGLDDKLRLCGYHNKISWLMLKLKALDVEYGKTKAAKQRKDVNKNESIQSV